METTFRHSIQPPPGPCASGAVRRQAGNGFQTLITARHSQARYSDGTCLALVLGGSVVLWAAIAAIFPA